MQMQGYEAMWQLVLDAHLHCVYPGLEEAMALYERALAINEAAYGAHHTDAANTLTNMGDVTFGVLA